MPRRRFATGSVYEERAGYCRAVAEGPWVFVSGTTGFDYETMAISDDVAEQAEQCMRNITRALEALDSSLADVVRVQVFLGKQEYFPRVADVLGRHLREVRPANTTVVAELIDPRMKVEIDATALRPGA